jgi:hypothetical protein
MLRHTFGLLVLVAGFVLLGWLFPPSGSRYAVLREDAYFDKVRGAWQASLVANHSGLALQGVYLDEPGPGASVELLLLDQWSTDDDTSVEWVDLHILEIHGLEPTYEQIRDEWVLHLNHDIWVAALRARQLMDQGVLPPDTGSAELNPDGAWSIGAQLQTELFGLLAPGMPDEASRRAAYFARVTNSGPAVEASRFYAAMYAMAFIEDDVGTLVRQAQQRFPASSTVYQIADNVQRWHGQNPEDWRKTRRLIRDAYDNDPMWWASRVNFASTLMALLYGQGDLQETLNIAGLAGWDADNNMTTAAGLLGIIHGFAGLPDPIRVASDVYFNEDVTGDPVPSSAHHMPTYQTVPDIAARTQALAEQAIVEAGGRVDSGRYLIPMTIP